MMTLVGVPIVWCWLLAAMTIIYTGIKSPDTVMPLLDGFVALLAIVGTLATLIVTSMLELWKSEQQKEVEVIPARLEHAIALNAEERRHAMEMKALNIAIESGNMAEVNKHIEHLKDLHNDD